MPYPVPPPAPAIVHASQPTTLPTSATPPTAAVPAVPTPPERSPISIEAVRSAPVLKNAAGLVQSIAIPESISQTPPPPSTPFPPGQPSQPAPPVSPSPTPSVSPSPAPPVSPSPTPSTSPSPPLSPSPTPTPTPSNIPTQQLTNQGFLELRADQQVYDEQRQVFTAEGNVSLRFRGALLTSQRLQVNLLNRLAVADGNVVLTRGDQVLRGQRFRYNLIQEEGTVEQASGEIFLPSAGTDFNPNLPTDITAGAVPVGSVGDRLTANQPPQGVSRAGSAGIVLGSRRNPSGAAVVPELGGTVRRLRFQAEQIAFYPEGWQARNVRITNDPFSPPELELQAAQAELRRLSPLRDEVVASRPRLVFDQGFSLPLLRNRVVLDRNPRPAPTFRLGIDADDRGGVFIERDVPVIPQGPVQFTVTPQFFVQRAIQDRNNIGDLFGLRTKLTAPLGPRTGLRGEAVLTSFDFSKVEDNLRGSLRAQQLVGTHTLSLEASYRNRLFNNSLGFQDVQSSVGALFYSPTIFLGDTGIALSYQVGYQFVNADTDRLDLLEPTRNNDRISLGRLQASAAINKGFTLWQGTPLPATKEQGLRYSPTPIVPYVALGVGLTGTSSNYSNGDSQNNLNATVGLYGQFGRFSRPFLDYTAFNVTYTQAFRDGLSPFLFDRVADDRILSAGITQQIYGPIRVGFQTSYNVQTGREISTDYFLEYSRRAYSVGLRYNPTLQLGSISLQISDFNWTGGGSEPFEGSGVRPVQGGVQQLPE